MDLKAISFQERHESATQREREQICATITLRECVTLCVPDGGWERKWVGLECEVTQERPPKKKFLE